MRVTVLIKSRWKDFAYGTSFFLLVIIYRTSIKFKKNIIAEITLIVGC